MKDCNEKRLRYPRLALGTVQFGLDYGVNNTRGKVSYDEILRILTCCADAGITVLDTSRVYGTSEQVIGKALDELRLREKFVICTKLDLPDRYEQLTDLSLEQVVLDSLQMSLEALRCDSIPTYMLHTYDYMHVHDGLIWNILRQQKARGRIKHLGVSICGDTDEALAALDTKDVEWLQIPYNVLDNRWELNGVFDLCERNKITLVNRSTFLQGLLLMDLESARQRVPASAGFMQRLHTIALRYEIPVKEMVFRFVLHESRISYTLVGVDCFEQLSENIVLYEHGPLDGQIVADLKKALTGAPVTLVNPALWK